MTEPPRRLPITAEERLRTVVSRVAGGSDAGSTRFARPVRPNPNRRPVDNGENVGAVHCGDTTGYTTATAVVSTAGDSPETVATGDGAVAIGYGCAALSRDDIAIGASAYTGTGTAGNSIAVGNSAAATNRNSVAVGAGAQASGDTSVALGPNAVAAAVNDFVLGTVDSNVQVPGKLILADSAGGLHQIVVSAGGALSTVAYP